DSSLTLRVGVMGTRPGTWRIALRGCPNLPPRANSQFVLSCALPGAMVLPRPVRGRTDTGGSIVNPRQSDRDREQPATTSEKDSTPTQEEVKPAPEKEGKLSAFWKVCGGTLLSICAMLSVTAYQNLTNHIGGVSKDLVNLNTDMRKELSRL